MKFYFFDSCAIARYYCIDIGTSIIQQLVSSGNGLVMSSFSSVEVISAFAALKRGNHTGFGNPEFNNATNAFQADQDKKFLLLEMNSKSFNKAIELIKNYNTYRLHSADALLLATCLNFSDLAATDNHQVVFITSDQAVYDVAIIESQTRTYFSAFHFWQCQCRNCHSVFKIIKYELAKCPNCGQVVCNKCQITNCTNKLLVNV